jgi:hypothetical protein
MVLNGRQKVGVVVLTVGAVALVVDRAFVLPKSAPASDRAVPVVEKGLRAASGERPTPSSLETSSVQTVTRRLEAAWSEKGLSFEAPRDLFSLSGSWGRDPDPLPGDRLTGRGDASFVRTYKLEAIIEDEEGRHASINDRLLRLGDSLDGYTLVEIQSESVLFEREGRRIELRLEKDR